MPATMMSASKPSIRPNCAEPHAVDRRSVARVADGAVAEVDLLDDERASRRDRTRRRRAIVVGRDHRELDVGQLEQRAPQRLQALGLDPVVVGQQHAHRVSSYSWPRRVSVRDADQRQPVRRRGRGGLAAGPAAQQRANSPRVRLPNATCSIVPTRTRFMWRMNVSAVIQNSSSSTVLAPLGDGHRRARTHVAGLGRRERGEVVACPAAPRRRRGAPRGRARAATHIARSPSQTERVRRLSTR